MNSEEKYKLPGSSKSPSGGFGGLYLPNRFYLALGVCILLFIISYFIPALFIVAKGGFYLLLFFMLADFIFLFLLGEAPLAKRIMADRFSNGDENKVTLKVTNRMRFDVEMEIIDELPEQFQIRDLTLKHHFKPGQEKQIVFILRPTERGEYDFGDIILYTKSRLGLVMRRDDAAAHITIPVYPSFMQLRKYELLSQTTIQSEHGNKRMRKIGHSMEFEQIKEYVGGDDIRTIN